MRIQSQWKRSESRDARESRPDRAERSLWGREWSVTGAEACSAGALQSRRRCEATEGRLLPLEDANTFWSRREIKTLELKTTCRKHLLIEELKPLFLRV